MCIRDRKGCAKKPVAQGVTANPGPATGATPTHDVAVPLKSTLAESGTGKLPSFTSIAVYVTTSLTPSVAVNAICPLTSVTLGFGAVMIEWPAPCDNAISLPGVGRLSASFSVTVIVDVLVWSGGTLVGDAAMPAPAAGGTRNSMPGWSASTTLSVVSVAVKTSVSCVRSVTVNTTAPLLPSDVPLAGVITALPPAASVTVLPATILPIASTSRTTTKLCVLPSAMPGSGSPKLLGAANASSTVNAPTCDTAASTGPVVCDVSCWCRLARFGDPKPTRANTLPMLAGEWKAPLPASGYSSGLKKPRLLPCDWLSIAANAAHDGADLLVPP